MIKRVLTGCLMTAAFVTANVFPVLADTNTTSISNAGSGSTTVSYVQESTFTISIPKTITLTKAEEAGKTIYKSDYTIYLTSDPDNLVKADTITVAPEEQTATLEDRNGKADVTANVIQADTTFTYDSHDDITGTVKAEGLTAGNWEGYIRFALTLSKG